MTVTDEMVERALVSYEANLLKLHSEKYKASDPISVSEIRSGCLRAALTAALSDQWQDISTAPKDGCMVLIAGRYKNGVTFVETSYWDSRGYWAARKLDPPTHWQPLPAPPPSSTAGGGE